MRLARAIVAAAAGAAFILVAPAAWASAAPPRGCPARFLCFWEHHHFTGRMGQVVSNNSNFGGLRTTACDGHDWDDCASSVYNHGTSCTVYLYRDRNYSGQYHTLSIGDYKNIPDWDASFNDDLSSNHWCTPR